MVKETRAEAFAYVIKDSAHFVPEGEVTKFGFSLSLLKVLRGEPWLTYDDLEALTEEEARKLFEQCYWDSLLCDRLPRGIDYMVFDSAVVYGSELTSRWLHFALNLSPTWPMRRSLFVLAAESDKARLIGELEQYRRRFSRNHVMWGIMGSLWSNRTTRVRSRACKLAGVKYEPRGIG